eukprot:1179184-Prorocentrum_minimum.AAC.1
MRRGFVSVSRRSRESPACASLGLVGGRINIPYYIRGGDHEGHIRAAHRKSDERGQASLNSKWRERSAGPGIPGGGLFLPTIGGRLYPVQATLVAYTIAHNLRTENPNETKERLGGLIALIYRLRGDSELPPEFVPLGKGDDRRVVMLEVSYAAALGLMSTKEAEKKKKYEDTLERLRSDGWEPVLYIGARDARRDIPFTAVLVLEDLGVRGSELDKLLADIHMIAISKADRFLDDARPRQPGDRTSRAPRGLREASPRSSKGVGGRRPHRDRQGNKVQIKGLARGVLAIHVEIFTVGENCEFFEIANSN